MVELDLRRRAVREAVLTLRYLHPSAEATVLELLERCGPLHPRAVAGAYRKVGEQISTAEKKALGLRKNAFMSKAALAELTDVGLMRPLDAHADTLSRAIFTVFRARTVQTGLERGVDGFKHDGLFAECPGCRRLNHRVVKAEEAAVFPPADCNRAACAIGIRLHIDFFKDIT